MNIKSIRPSTAKVRKTKKPKKKGQKAKYEKYLEQLRQQQILQQLAMEQQNYANQIQNQEQVEEEEDIQISPQQAAEILQHLMMRQQNGEELTQEEVEQFQFLQQIIESNIAQQQEIDDNQQVQYVYPVRKVAKRKKSKGKKKKPKKKRVDEQALMMMLNQQREQQQPQIPNLPYGVDEIKEVDEEETPIKGLSNAGHNMQEHQEVDDSDEEAPEEVDKAEVHYTDIPTQINAQVPAKFRFQENQEEVSEEDSKYNQPQFYPQYQLNPVEQDCSPVLANISPQHLHYLQELNKNQMIASKLDYYSGFYNPLSQLVHNAKQSLK